MDDQPERAPIASSALSVILTVGGVTGWEEALAAWASYLNGLDRDYELLLASEYRDVSVEEAASRYARGRALPAVENDGFGTALQRGLAAAKNPLVFYTRCDARHKPADLQPLLKWIDRVDLVAGYRVFPRGFSRSRWRALAFRLLTRFLFAVRLRDPGCLCLLARRALFVRIPVQSKGIFAHAEVIAKANVLGCLMHDAPVSYHPLEGEQADPALRDVKADVRRVFLHPDFGPAEARLDLHAGAPMPD